MENWTIKTALVSVTDKSELDILAASLKKFDVKIIASGGTRKYLEDKGFSVTPVEEITKNPEAFSGRMKTLSFQLASGLLFKRDCPKDLEEAQNLNILPIDLVVCNLYPFEKVAENEDNWDKLIEEIDIGGPTMIRAAAKNFKYVTVLTSSSQYSHFIEDLNKNHGKISQNLRQEMAYTAFQYTAHYEMKIASKWGEISSRDLDQVSFSLKDARPLRYGENPHQKALLLKNPWDKRGFAQISPLQGKELSYNNILDSDAALRSCLDLVHLDPQMKKVAVTIIKHSNPCGAALSSHPHLSLEMAWGGDPISAFGSIICFSHEVTEEAAVFLKDKFVEVILAPSFSKEALNYFGQKKNLRLLELGSFDFQIKDPMLRSVWGGAVYQDEDFSEDLNFENVTRKKFDDQQMTLARFGVRVAKHLRSNAIVLVQETDKGMSIAGAGMGNPNRLVSLDQAILKAKENDINEFSKLILVSDAFFPFKDNIDLAHKANIEMIVQPGGSLRDQEVIDTCDQYNMKMLFTKIRHFRH